MPAPPPPPKRRRLDTSSAALSKPFKSPLKSSPNPLSAAPAVATPSPKAKSSLSVSQPTPSNPTLSPPKLPSPGKSSPELLDLRRQHASLLASLSTARSSLDIAKQAHKLETGDIDAELERLIKKWKAASREAAEEMFGEMRDKVNRMGGVKGWRERERERVRRMEEFRQEWGGEEGVRAKAEGEGEGEGDKDEEDEEGEGREVQRREEGEQRVEEDDDEGFTIDMMLRSLNIDLELIGFDKEGQRWLE